MTEERKHAIISAAALLQAQFIWRGAISGGQSQDIAFLREIWWT
jgi:hypothetical protein